MFLVCKLQMMTVEREEIFDSLEKGIYNSFLYVPYIILCLFYLVELEWLCTCVEGVHVLNKVVLRLLDLLLPS